jgi:hypothetical protein
MVHVLSNPVCHTECPSGPDKTSPIYQYVVAINDDTLYVSSFLDLSGEPVILTIPESSDLSYSVLMLDPYGDKIMQSVITPPAPGTFGLYGPGFKGTLPTGITPVPLPLNYIALIFRVDKFANGVDLTSQADSFRRALATSRCVRICARPARQTLLQEGLQRSCGRPRSHFRSRQLPTRLSRQILFFSLRMLQIAVLSKKTPNSSPEVQELSDEFNALFAKVRTERSEFVKGTQAAHAAIVNDYLNNTGQTNCITYTNIGTWAPDEFIQRSSITQFIQYANDHEAAAYYHAFKDGDGLPLDGADPNGYVLTFSAAEIPVAKRFWSLTAYTPEAIELVPNAANKYVVASYIQPEVDKKDQSRFI